MIHRQGNRQHGMHILERLRIWAFGFVAVLVASSSALAVAAQPNTITSLSALHSLPNAEAAKSIPVAFEATVTYHIKGGAGIFVQDGNLAIYADVPANVTVAPGDRVMIRGKTRAGFHPEVVAESVTVLGHQDIPSPARVGYAQLVHGHFDSARVKVRGTVRSADIVTHGKLPSIYLEVLVEGGGSIDAVIDSSDSQMVQNLRGAEVEVSGSNSGKFDSRDQLTGIVLRVPAVSDVHIVKAASTSPETIAVSPMDEIVDHSLVQDLSQPVRVEGTVTYYLPGAAVVLQSGARSLWIETRDEQPLTIGDHANALGFPEVRNGVLTLTAAEIEDSHQRSPVAAEKIGWDQLASGKSALDLVSIEGQVVKEAREENQDEYVLTAGNHIFSVVYRYIDQDLGFALPPMKQVPVGAMVSITGVASSYRSNPFAGPAGPDVMLRSFDDIEVIQNPSRMNVQNLTRLVVVLLAVILIIAILHLWTGHNARRYNATMAYIERRRGQILIDINNARPLAEILENIAELVTTHLNGAPCWIEVEDGATLGKHVPSESLTGMRVTAHDIQGHSGANLGSIHCVFQGHAKPRSEEKEALAQAAGLAALAIETSRLYADLVHRSEFDQLTDIRNRFSFEMQIEGAIEVARQSAGLFGLLYIDLDEFKQVNDEHGHQTGDFYLQKVTVRMKHQLRPADILARLGGDEFAVILPRVHGRSDLEEVSARLQRCFEQPFVLEDCTVSGSASIGIAMYPADGTDRDTLLDSADAAMYKAKDAKRSVAPD